MAREKVCVAGCEANLLELARFRASRQQRALGFGPRRGRQRTDAARVQVADDDDEPLGDGAAAALAQLLVAQQLAQRLLAVLEHHRVVARGVLVDLLRPACVCAA